MSKKYLQKLRWIIDNSKEDIGVFISFILAIFPLSFVTNSYLFALKNLEQNKGTENIQNIFLYVCISFRQEKCIAIILHYNVIP